MGGKPLLTSMKSDFAAVVIAFSFKCVACAHRTHMFFLAKQHKYEASWISVVISKD